MEIVPLLQLKPVTMFTAPVTKASTTVLDLAYDFLNDTGENCKLKI